ncbi:riboflavin kinase [Domibacillus iocasae]|uniref:riboflavin kinase n=1 Tax=Domibacillus iocasae TaxID=1714016 RepID=UPI0009F46F0E|nr:riboflavin kinase [Domibacillus iocasae]
MVNVQDVQWISKPVIRGEVVHGMKMGRKLGFPIENLSQSPHWIENGVYGVQIRVENQLFEGGMNVGVKPTFSSRLKE